MNKVKVKSLITSAIKKKLANYQPETEHKPFHERLLGGDRMALFSFIHSMNTTFGMSIFETVAQIIAEDTFKVAKAQAKSGESISSESQRVIQTIMDDITTGATKPEKLKEIELIRKVANEGKEVKVKPTKVDIYLQAHDNTIYLIDIKTVKPNMGGFKEFKRTLLEWVGTTLYHTPQAKVQSIIAIPYNPYHPEPYNRWTMAGMLDLPNELKVAEEFWNFLGGDGTYEQLLDCFEEVGLELREEIDKYFKRFDK